MRTFPLGQNPRAVHTYTRIPKHAHGEDETTPFRPRHKSHTMTYKAHVALPSSRSIANIPGALTSALALGSQLSGLSLIVSILCHDSKQHKYPSESSVGALCCNKESTLELEAKSLTNLINPKTENFCTTRRGTRRRPYTAWLWLLKDSNTPQSHQTNASTSVGDGK